jgi:hypothetical protein
MQGRALSSLNYVEREVFVKEEEEEERHGANAWTMHLQQCLFLLTC